MIERKFNKITLDPKISEEIEEALPNLVFTTGIRDGWTIIRIDSDSISIEDDEEIARIVSIHVPNDPLITQTEKTKEKLKEAEELWGKILNHIILTSPVSSIDPFLLIADKMILFERLLLWNMGESALRVLSKQIAPLGIFAHIDLYKAWLRDFCKKHNSNLTDAMLDHIEAAEDV